MVSIITASDFFVKGTSQSLTSSSLTAVALLLPSILCLRGNLYSDAPTEEVLSKIYLHLILQIRVVLLSLSALTNLLHSVQDMYLCSPDFT
jgi:hypothetical protein